MVNPPRGRTHRQAISLLRKLSGATLVEAKRVVDSL
jgi:ribosomal protein L7/L12